MTLPLLPLKANPSLFVPFDKKAENVVAVRPLASQSHSNSHTGGGCPAPSGFAHGGHRPAPQARLGPRQGRVWRDECGPRATALRSRPGRRLGLPLPPPRASGVPRWSDSPAPLRQARGLAGLSPQLRGPVRQCQGLPSQPLPVATRSRLTQGSRRAGPTVTQAHAADSLHLPRPSQPRGDRHLVQSHVREVGGGAAALTVPLRDGV